MSTPDPTPAPLPPARPSGFMSAFEIEATRKLLDIRATMSADEFVDYVSALRGSARALLAHLDALTPRAVVDGEALGREARASHMDWSEDTASVWPFLTEKVRGDYCRTAIHVHAIGYAAGAVAMTGEGDDPGTEGAVLILMKRHDGELHEAHAAGRSEGEAERVRATQEGIDIGRAQGWKEANVEIDRLVAARAAEHESAGVAIEGQQSEIARLAEECDAERVAVLDRDATIARLTAALADLDVLYQEQVRESQRLAADRERMEDERDAATAELAEARADRSHGPIADAALLTAKLYHDADNQSVQLAQIRAELDACRQEVAAARLDGAREERRLCNAALMSLRHHVSTRAGKRILEQAIDDANDRARATEGRQG